MANQWHLPGLIPSGNRFGRRGNHLVNTKSNHPIWLLGRRALGSGARRSTHQSTQQNRPFQSANHSMVGSAGGRQGYGATMVRFPPGGWYESASTSSGTRQNKQLRLVLPRTRGTPSEAQCVELEKLRNNLRKMVRADLRLPTCTVARQRGPVTKLRKKLRRFLRSAACVVLRLARYAPPTIPRKLPRMIWYAETQNYECFYE
jgi:hypothetical protein